jgi:hypothetical protein
MFDRLKLTLGGVWMIASVSALLIPVFVPSYPHPSGSSPIATATITMFLLSFPTSVIATPVLLMINSMLNMTTSSIGVAYMNLVVLFAVGLVQWFWVVPRLLWRKAFMQELDLGKAVGNTRLFARDLTVWLDARGSTPVERVIEETEQSASATREVDPQ